MVTALDLALWGIRFLYDDLPRTIPELTQGIPPAPDNPAESYAAAPKHGPYRGDLLVLRGYRLTTGYVGLFPATRHKLGGGVALQLSGTRWLFTRDGVRQPVEGGAERVRLLDEHGRTSAPRGS